MYNSIETPNQSLGRKGQKPEAIVIHITDGSYESALAWFQNPRSQVSAHFLISRTGDRTEIVKLENTAWHCGNIVRPKWPLLKENINPNLYTIGIELAGKSPEKPTISQIIETQQLVKELTERYNISLDIQHIIPHNWIRADKTCPGPNINLAAIVYLACLNG